jgi:hypothetical protein
MELEIKGRKEERCKQKEYLAVLQITPLQLPTSVGSGGAIPILGDKNGVKLAGIFNFAYLSKKLKNP